MSEENKQEVLGRLKDGVINYNEEAVKEAAEEALEAGIDAYEAIMDGLTAGMVVVGDLYEKKDYFVPELLMCADALYVGLNVLNPHIKQESRGEIKGQVVIGTVQGDVHDVGKNLIKIMFEVAGFTVHDLGRDVPLEKFVEEQMKTDADIVAISAMMTTTMLGMQKAVEMIRERNPNVAIMLGGAPLTQEVASLFGADGYAESAGNAVQEALKMLKNLREMRKK
ncbi:MAG: cobalamin-dependent protein [Dehalococcoidia bacterium]|nr:cobalamin-dependent protein [Dehalococcoidia bacterium]MDP7240141.1 cobalamin-dependent protein [Dehalococcoidia bacterium]MDP7470128.1 cobalamin-dependent protein [Dehalococcoidia bacterium]